MAGLNGALLCLRPSVESLGMEILGGNTGGGRSDCLVQPMTWIEDAGGEGKLELALALEFDFGAILGNRSDGSSLVLIPSFTTIENEGGNVGSGLLLPLMLCPFFTCDILLELQPIVGGCVKFGLGFMRPNVISDQNKTRRKMHGFGRDNRRSSRF